MFLDVGDGAEEFGVFGRTADGDADRFGETHPGHWADDHTFAKKFIAVGFGIWANLHEEKISFAGNRTEPETAKFGIRDAYARPRFIAAERSTCSLSSRAASAAAWPTLVTLNGVRSLFISATSVGWPMP